MPHRFRSKTEFSLRRARRIAADPAAALAKLRALSRARLHDALRPIAPRSSPASASIVLGREQALRENGFVVFRGLFSAAECARLAANFKQGAGITEGVHFTRTDATNKVPATRQVLFDERILGAVGSVLGDDEVRFLQPSDLHYLHDTTGWHRDSVHRSRDNSDAPDWSDEQGRFGVVKAILYLESDNAAMGMMAGSHLSPIEIDTQFVKVCESRGRHLVIDEYDEPNRRLTAEQKTVPIAWKALVGDVLIFDQRMYHAGRRVDHGRVTRDRDAAKFTLSLVFGLDNMHSERFYSYFRFARREIGYHGFAPDFLAQLQARDLILRSGLGNYYEQHPDELRLATLRRPETMETLIAEFAHSRTS